MIRVAIADDQQLIRGGFRSLLEAEPDLDVVGEAGTGAEAAALVTRERPDVVLRDIRMPEGDGFCHRADRGRSGARGHSYRDRDNLRAR